VKDIVDYPVTCNFYVFLVYLFRRFQFRDFTDSIMVVGLQNHKSTNVDIRYGRVGIRLTTCRCSFQTFI